MDEGYIKFDAHWVRKPPLPAAQTAQLNAFRQKLYEQGLIGAYPEGIGFGNISRRQGRGHQFIISGSKTGNVPALDERHYALVTEVDAAHNRLRCEGPIIASSESMSHAVIYEECPEVQAVLHVHHLQMWQRLLHRVPTTAADAPYGSPEMVESIRQLLRETALRQQRIFVMEGHREGVFVFGESLEAAYGCLMHWYHAEAPAEDK
ncbi:MAG: class II aldolase/adducin family protein [Bacteroidetes bacterium]|nr:class II aldolase/adducin family protein [Bacteroidota bacterium]